MAQQAARKPDSVLDDHSSRRRVTAPLQQPTRKFRQSGRSQTKLSAWAHRADTLPPAGECGRDPCLFGLAPCGVYHATSITGRPVRSYRTFSPLPHLLRDTAVSSLLHWPSMCLEAHIPDVIRHTTLRSPDFPPPPQAHAQGGSDHPAACTSSVSRVRAGARNCYATVRSGVFGLPSSRRLKYRQKMTASARPMAS